MSTTDFKLIAAINETLPPGNAMNVAGHLGIGIAARIVAQQDLGSAALELQDYADADGGSHAFISGLPFVILRASPSELRKLRGKCLDAAITFVDFTSTMVGGTYVEQLEKSRATPQADILYYGVAAYARRDVIDPLTKRMSLWK